MRFVFKGDPVVVVNVVLVVHNFFLERGWLECFWWWWLEYNLLIMKART